MDGGVIKMENFKHAIGAWASQHLFRATWHGMAWQRSQQLTGHLIPAQSCCCGFGAIGEGEGEGEAGLESWRAGELEGCLSQDSVHLSAWHQSLQHPDRGGVKNAGLLFYWPSTKTVCERQRRLRKKRRLTPQGRPKEQLWMAALRQMTLSLPQPESKAGWAGRL
jgi:hypothetical protein